MTPTELRLSKDKRTLGVRFDAVSYELSAEYLRVESPSAEVKGHGPHQARLISGKRDVTVTGLEPTGNYAVKITFSDGHATGIFTWEYLEMLGREHATLWARYEKDMAAASLSRDKAGPVVLRANLS